MDTHKEQTYSNQENEVLPARIKELEDRLISCEKAMERARNAKALFLANISHELRTPLNGIIGFASLLKDATLGEEEQDYAQIVYQSAQSLLCTLNNIIEISVIASKEFRLREKPFNILKSIDSALKKTQIRVDQKNLLLTSSVSPDTEEIIIADGNRIKQMLDHLLENAVKFTEEGSISLTVRSRPVEGNRVQITFCVKDTGIGICQNQINLLLQPFEQADPSGTRKYGGLGIGLAVIKSLCAYMNGTLTLESKINEGCTATVSFEAGLPEKPIERPAVSLPEKPHIPSLCPRILVAEDEYTNQELMKFILVKLNCAFDIVSNGEQAFMAIEKKRYDLVFMDIAMPRLSGIEVTEKVFQSGLRDHAPLIVGLSAHVTEKDEKACKKAGMDQFIGKPFDIKDIEKIILQLRERMP